MAKSLNKVQLIGNLTRDPELKYTPQGTAVCTFGIATNRQWTTESGEKKDEADFHRIVSWSKLAEICAQLLKKGRKVYLEGRLQTRTWEGQDGEKRSTTEVVISDMILLDSKGFDSGSDLSEFDVPESKVAETVAEPQVDEAPVKEKGKKKSAKKTDDQVDEEDIPF